MAVGRERAHLTAEGVVSTQRSLFTDAAAERARIAAEIARRFACYGEGTDANPRNATGLTLKDQPAQFGFGVHVREVVDAVLDLAGALPPETAQ